MRTFLILATIMLASVAQGAQEVKYIGKFLHLKDKKESLTGHQYYFVIYDKKETYAYPVDSLTEKQKEMIRKNLNNKAYIKASITQKKVTVGERKQDLGIMKVKSLKFLKLENLALGNISAEDKEFQMKSKERNPHYSDTGLLKVNGINDTLTNSAIFIGGAALLGSMLLGK